MPPLQLALAIDIVRADYAGDVSGAGGAPAILMEDSGYVLMETGSHILME